jgi:UDP-N-acetylglucosamine 2-epimerase (non-hydrolysing)
MKIISVVGARPNFMKIAPLVHAIEDHNQSIKDEGDGSRHIDHKLVHTGQHYDDKMSRAFFEALSIPEADINLGIGSGTHAEQVGHTMIAFEKVLKEHKPDWVIVVGDVNATCACSITAKKEHVKVAHVEAGLRSFDLKMPEEINRMVTDRLSDLLLTPCKISCDNLKSEGVSDQRIRFVGNIMIDTLEAQREKASLLDVGEIVRQNQLVEGSVLNVSSLDRFAVMTLHRPSNVDTKEVLGPIIDFLCDEVANDMPLIWPMHPRARKQLEAFDLWEKVAATDNLLLLHPLGYHELLRLNMDAAIMLTDSGGLQEECCVLGTPCLTMRWNTERPVTLQEHGGASVLVGNSIDRLRDAYQSALKSERSPQRPELWDGRTAQRIVEAILEQSCSLAEMAGT